MPIKDRIDEAIYKDFITLKKYLNRFTKRAYLVGGAVRDLFLGNEIKDLDIEVYDICPEKFEKIMKKLGAIGVGKKFFVYKWNDIDISLPRLERKNGIGHKAFDVKVTNSEKEASRRRDFTINALMLDIFEGKMLDFWGGLRDLEHKIIKIVDKESFAEDSLRVLRAMQFAARFGFRCDRDSVEIMRAIELSDLSKERIFWEFEKLFFAKNLHIGAYYLFKLGIFKKLFGYDVKCSEFFAIYREFKFFSKYFLKDLYEYYFLYIVCNNLKIDINYILQKINAPKVYEKFYKKQPLFIENIDDRYILEVALKIPIRLWLPSYKPEIKKRALELGVYHSKLDTGVKSFEVIKDGFIGKDIKEEIRRREFEYIDNFLKNFDLKR